MYKNRYYLYYPCDVGILYRLYVGKQKIQEYGFEMQEYAVMSLHKRNSNIYSFDMANPQGERKKVLIYLINEKSSCNRQAISENCNKSIHKENGLHSTKNISSL